MIAAKVSDFYNLLFDVTKNKINVNNHDMAINIIYLKRYFLNICLYFKIKLSLTVGEVDVGGHC